MENLKNSVINWKQTLFLLIVMFVVSLSGTGCAGLTANPNNSGEMISGNSVTDRGLLTSEGSVNVDETTFDSAFIAGSGNSIASILESRQSAINNTTPLADVNGAGVACSGKTVYLHDPRDISKSVVYEEKYSCE